MQVLDPAALIFLLGQGSQAVLPYTALKVSSGHIFGVDMPSVPQKEPGSAMEQVLDPVKYWYVPFVQLLQSSMLFEPTMSESMKDPVGHFEQAPKVGAWLTHAK